jgi:hypothetical protein
VGLISLKLKDMVANLRLICDAFFLFSFTVLNMLVGCKY